MKDSTAEVFREWMGLILLAIGWNAQASAFFGGMLMGLGGASVARAWRRERNDVELWRVIWGGFFVTFLAGLIAAHFAPNWPVQIVMGVAGFFSRFAIKFFLDAAERVGGKGAKAGDKLNQRLKLDD